MRVLCVVLRAVLCCVYGVAVCKSLDSEEDCICLCYVPILGAVLFVGVSVVLYDVCVARVR